VIVLTVMPARHGQQPRRGAINHRLALTLGLGRGVPFARYAVPGKRFCCC
jgi:hypothetical protein